MRKVLERDEFHGTVCQKAGSPVLSVCRMDHLGCWALGRLLSVDAEALPERYLQGRATFTYSHVTRQSMLRA